MNWAPGRHALFAPADRAAVVGVLQVGKRLEQAGRGIFLDLWPRVLSFCGRGWFAPAEGGGRRWREVGDEAPESKAPAKGCRGQGYHGSDESDDEAYRDTSMQCSFASSFEESSGGEETVEEYTQFQLEETTDSMAAII